MIQSTLIRQAIPTPPSLRNITVADGVRAMAFRVTQGDKVNFVALGSGGGSFTCVWMTEVTEMALQILLTAPSPDAPVRINIIRDYLDLREMLRNSSHMDKYMILGMMTDGLQNRLLRELNVVG